MYIYIAIYNKHLFPPKKKKTYYDIYSHTHTYGITDSRIFVGRIGFL